MTTYDMCNQVRYTVKYELKKEIKHAPENPTSSFIYVKASVARENSRKYDREIDRGSRGEY